MFPNVKASEQVALLDVISPVSHAASAASTGWISAAAFNKFLGVVLTGVLGSSATVDAKFEQATSSGGAGAKDVTATIATQLVKASNDNNEVLINLDASQLDVANGFDYVRLTVTVGTAASLIAAAVLGFNPRFAPGSDSNNASVVQVVN